MMDRRGLEFSVGFLVMIIFSVFVFGLSLYLLFDWFGELDEVQADLDSRTINEIHSRLRSKGGLVAIPFNVVSVRRGDSASFGLGIRNNGIQRTFSVVVRFSNAYSGSGDLLGVDP